MNRSVFLIAPCALLAACSVGGKGFVASRDYGRVADCYAAYMSIGIDARDPALGYSADQVELENEVNLESVQRLQPYLKPASKKAGGDGKFLQLVAAWRLRPDNNIDQPASPEQKRAIYQHILLEASQCHGTLSHWGAPMRPPVSAPKVETKT